MVTAPDSLMYRARCRPIDAPRAPRSLTPYECSETLYGNLNDASAAISEFP